MALCQNNHRIAHMGIYKTEWTFSLLFFILKLKLNKLP